SMFAIGAVHTDESPIDLREATPRSPGHAAIFRAMKIGEDIEARIPLESIVFEICRAVRSVGSGWVRAFILFESCSPTLAAVERSVGHHHPLAFFGRKHHRPTNHPASVMRIGGKVNLPMIILRKVGTHLHIRSHLNASGTNHTCLCPKG